MAHPRPCPGQAHGTSLCRPATRVFGPYQHLKPVELVHLQRSSSSLTAKSQLMMRLPFTTVTRNTLQHSSGPSRERNHPHHRVGFRTESLQLAMPGSSLQFFPMSHSGRIYTLRTTFPPRKTSFPTAWITRASERWRVS
jgi:hypothetical protein